MFKKTMISVAATFLLATSCGSENAPREAGRTIRALGPVECSNGPGESNVRTFETNTVEGIELYKADGPLPFAPVLRKPLEVRTVGAGRALAADVQMGGTALLEGQSPGSSMWLRVPLCKGGGTIDLTGKKVSAKLFIDGSALATPPAKFWAGLLLPQGWGGIAERAGVPARSDETISGNVPQNEGASKVNHLILSVAIGGPTGPAGWTGTILVDDIQIQ